MPLKDATARVAYAKAWRDARHPPKPAPLGQLIVGPSWRAYAAGLVDGEGCIIISKRKRSRNRRHLYVNKVVINMVTPECIKKMQFLFGGSINLKRNYKKANANSSFAWTVSGKLATRFLEQIQPYLILKQPQAAAALWVLRSMAKDPNGKKLTAETLATRERCREICRENNRRGKNGNGIDAAAS